MGVAAHARAREHSGRAVKPVLESDNLPGEWPSNAFDRRRRNGLDPAAAALAAVQARQLDRYLERCAVSPQASSAEVMADERLDPFSLLMRIRDVEGGQREFTMQLSHMTATFSGALQPMQKDIERMVVLLERREAEQRVTEQKVSEFRGALKAVSLIGGLLIAVVIAYFQLQVSTIYGRIDSNATSIRELQRK